RPHVRPRAAFPAAVFPRLVVRLAGTRHGPELPELLTRADVERADVARIALGQLADVRADDRDVAEDDRSSAVGYADVDGALVAELEDALTGSRVERDQPRAAHEQDARAAFAVAGPVAHSSRRRTPAAQRNDRRRRYLPLRPARRGEHVHPNFVAGIAVERDDA